MRTVTSDQSGFSLIEMMAALAVIALAGIAVVQMLQTTTQNTAALEERSLAMLAAENILNEQLLIAEDRGSRSGSYALAGVEYDWRLAINRTTDTALMQYVVTIHPDRQDRTLARIETFRRRSGT